MHAGMIFVIHCRLCHATVPISYIYRLDHRLRDTHFDVFRSALRESKKTGC